MGFFGFVFNCGKFLVLRILLLLLLLRHLSRDSPPTGSTSSPMGTVPRFTVVVGLTGDKLCHTRFPTVDYLS